MSTSSAVTSPRDFWSAIARLGTSGAPRMTWEFHASTDFPLLKPFLTATNGPPCHTVPCPVCEAPRRISILPDNTLLMEIGDYCAGCDDVLTLTREQIAPTVLNVTALKRAAASALQFQPDDSIEPGYVIALGTLRRNATLIPVALAFLAKATRDEINIVLSRFPVPTVFILPSPIATLVSNLRSRGYFVFPAAALLPPKPKGAFRAVKPLAAYVAEAEGGAQIRAVHEPLPMCGKRYKIDDGFVAITKLGKRPHRFEITQPKARSVLRALVESGAGTEASAIPKRQLLSIVYGGSEVPDIRPSQLLRGTGPGGTKPLPFRDDILKHNGSGGHYWLEL